MLRAGRMEVAARGILNAATLVPNFADPRSRPIARKPIPATSIDGVDEHQAGPPAAMKSGHSLLKTSLGARGPLSRFRSYPTVRYRHRFAVLAFTSANGLATWCRKK